MPLDNDLRAVKPSPAIGSEGMVLFRESSPVTLQPETVILLTYDPQVALEIGQAFIEVALELGAQPT